MADKEQGMAGYFAGTALMSRMQRIDAAGRAIADALMARPEHSPLGASHRNVDKEMDRLRRIRGMSDRLLLEMIAMKVLVDA